jgi:hypothetical protein
MLFLILFGLPALLLGGLVFAIVAMVTDLAKFPSHRSRRRDHGGIESTCDAPNHPT